MKRKKYITPPGFTCPSCGEESQIIEVNEDFDHAFGTDRCRWPGTRCCEVPVPWAEEIHPCDDPIDWEKEENYGDRN